MTGLRVEGCGLRNTGNGIRVAGCGVLGVRNIAGKNVQTQTLVCGS